MQWVGRDLIQDYKPVSENPFQAPSQARPPNYGPPSGAGYVKQIPVIASLMIVQGSLLLILVLVMVGYAFMFSKLMEMAGNDPQQPPQVKEMLKVQQQVLPYIFGAIAIFAGILAIMHFVAAYFGFCYKHRVFGIVTLIAGLGASLTFYCAPTAIGLGVYGLIIYFNPAVKKAFELGKSGMKSAEIRSQFPN